MTNTQMAVVAGTVAGAGALAPAPELTIDRNDVRIHLMRANHVEESQAYFQKLREKSSGRNWGHYYEAANALRGALDELVDDLRRSGGLLHFGRGV